MSKHRKFSPEDRLLLLLARRTLTPNLRTEASRLLGQQLNWSHILRKAQFHHVTPLLYHNLKELNFNALPGAVRAELENRYRVNALWSSLLLRELKLILARFAEIGIPVVPLKGLALAASLYGDIALRNAGDIDILAPRERVIQALNVLLSMGYKTHLAYEDAIKLGTSSGEYQLVRREGQLHYPVELHSTPVHWSEPFVPMIRCGLNDLWAEARLKSVFGERVYTLSPEWELLFLASHAAYHHTWQKLKWLLDIHELCSQVEIDWSKLWKKARPLGVEQILQITLNICYTLFETTTLADFSVDRLPSWVNVFPDDRSDEEIQLQAMRLRLISRPSDKARYAYQLYFQIINHYLSKGDSLAAETIIYQFAQTCGLLAMLYLIVRLAVSSPLTALGSFVRPADERGRKAAVRLALRQSIKIAFRYRQFFGTSHLP